MAGKFKGRYPPEFRADAVELYRTSGKSLKVVSEELGAFIDTPSSSLTESHRHL